MVIPLGRVLAFVLVLIAIVMAPHAIDTYLAGRK
jgi:hypothetical protein